MSENKHTLKLEGRSGCRIELLGDSGKPVVRKYAKDLGYNNRLLRQAGKQAVFNQYLDLPSMKAPNVLGMSGASKEELTWFDMEYLSAQKFSTHFERTSLQGVRYLVRVLLDYFEFSIDKSINAEVNPVVFLNKTDELAGKLVDNPKYDQELLRASLALLKEVPADKIITGRCHGDFTFSNLLFVGKQIYVIDFLDSFVESPIVDLVKMRQDTRYHWSLMLDDTISSYTRNRSIQLLHYIDEAIAEYIKSHSQLGLWYNYLQLFNFMRILPYVSDTGEIKFVEKVIKELIEECS